MYGVLFEVLRRYVESTFGETVWSAAVEVTNGQPLEIQTRQNYSTRLLTRIVSAVSEFIGLPEEDIYYEFGITTVQYLTDNGFRSILQVLGLSWIELIEKDSRFDQNPSLLDVSAYVSEKQFLGLLPFHLLLTKDMTIRRAGPSYLCLRKDILGQEFTKCFQIAKPKTNPTFDEIYANRFTTFELVLLDQSSSKSKSSKRTTGPQEKCRFKGEISFVEEWDMLLFMGSPL
uniref:guanylate cyclase n=1 Tax=Trichobilharzia regenti TaxID=157069 RepID=A0AA85JVD8_TRIRE|nr:unnamed protein product [Trichobilharzia regenti]